jgi:hypothetical protein
MRPRRADLDPLGDCLLQRSSARRVVAVGDVAPDGDL